MTEKECFFCKKVGILTECCNHCYNGSGKGDMHSIGIDYGASEFNLVFCHKCLPKSYVIFSGDVNTIMNSINKGL